ncbi:MAG: hypothetical protein ACI96M_004604, partial [Candidatus Azotimanducaceae bacterium]
QWIADTGLKPLNQTTERRRTHMKLRASFTKVQVSTQS